MFAESTQADKVKAELQGLNSDQHIESILIFLEKYIPTFTKEFKQKENESEPKINQKMSLHLHESLRNEKIYPYHFSNEHVNESSNRKEDIYINIKSNGEALTVFVIECKRLPAYSSKSEQEYVQGDGGGIERFKKLHHGEKYPIAAMIGYIEKDTFSFWFNKVNFWIEELTKQPKNTLWNKKDKLKKEYEQENIAKYKSENLRTNGTKILLFHFWILKK